MKKGLLALIIVLSVFMLSGCGSKKPSEPQSQEGKIKVNTNEDVIGSKEIDGLKIERASLVYEDNLSTLTTSVTNTKEEDITIDYIEITYTDEDGKETILIGEVGEILKQNQVVYITSTTDVDLTKAIKAEYKIVK